MRIVIDLQSCQNGSRHRGIGRYSMAMTKAIIRLGHGHEFIIVLSQSFPETIEDIRTDLAEFVPQDAFAVFAVPGQATAADPANAWRNRAAEMARTHFLENLRPDLVFIPSLNEGFWDNTIVSVERPVSYLTAVTLYDLIPLEDPHQYLGGEEDGNAYLRRLSQLRHADLVLPISEYVAQDARARLSLESKKIVVAHCGVDRNFVLSPQDPAPRPSFLADYGITRPYVMTASPLEPRKNLEGLIAGFASMPGDIRNSHQLVLLGKMDAFARNYLSDLAKCEGLPENSLVFSGYVPDSDLPELYRQCSVFAFPSFSEGFGLPLLEAMACGAPVIGSNRTSIPEVVGREDVLCDPTDAMAIGRSIERILSSSDLELELRAYGPRRAAQFTWEKSAATVLGAFEALQELRVPPRPAASQVGARALKSNLSRLAYVIPDVQVENRLAGVNSALLASLADLFDLTIICAGVFHLGRWLEVNCVVRDIDWFDRHADQFDYTLFGADLMADAAFRRLISRHAGSILLVNRLSVPPQEMLLGRKMFDGAQLASLELGGVRALSAATDSALQADEMVALLQRDMCERAGQVFYEAGHASPNVEGDLGPLATAMSEEARRAFRTRVGVADSTELVVVVAGSGLAAEEAIRVFRQTAIGQQASRTLALFDISSPTDGDPNAKRLFGNVVRISAELDQIYCGLLSGSDVLMLDNALAEPVLTHFVADAPRAHVVSFDGTDDRLPALLIDSGKVPWEHIDVTGAAGAGRVATILHSCLRKLEEGAPARLQKFIRRIPTEVRGIKPDADDLAQLAISVARNEGHGSPTMLLIDVTAFAGPNPAHRLDLPSRKFLRTLFRRAGRNVHPVYIDGDEFVVANQFAARICGIEKSNLQDYVAMIKPGDSILGLDICHAFSESSRDALKSGQRHGLAANYALLGSMGLDGEQSLSLLADVLLTWCGEARLNLSTSISKLPQARTSRSPAWKSHQRYEQVVALAEAGLHLNILLCEDAFGDALDDKAVIAELSPGVQKAVHEWEVLRQEPLSGVPHQPESGTDFGHVITGHLLGSYSLAIINRMMARTLAANYPGQVRFLPVETTPIDHTEGVPADEKPLLIELSSKTASMDRDEIVISHHYPILVPEGHYSLSLAMFFWEESQVPLPSIKALTDSFDAVISPACSVTKALIDSGLSIPVATIGQPVDVDRYAQLAASRKSRGEETTFLHVSSSFKRKGVDVLLSAWAMAFTSSDNVRLVIKTFPNPHNDVEKQVAELRARNPNIASIEIVNRDVPPEEMPQFYANADVMVLPTRGEGYNLPALEAMAAGLPLIVTGYGGHRDFCGDQEARLIQYHFGRSESHVGGGHSMWVEPEISDLAAALREQIDPAQALTIEARRQRAMVAALRESNEAAWLHRYDMMISELQKNLHHKPTRIAWVSTWGVQCGIAQYSRHLLDHLSSATKNRVIVVCDSRTEPGLRSDIEYLPVWDVRDVPKVEQLLQSIENSQAEAVVIQHQDGLLSWKQLGLLTHDERLATKVTIVILHNAGNMIRAGTDERSMMLDGLAKLSRVLVHNVADVNFLSSLGLEHNVGLLPHGAYARHQAPWPRKLGAADAPIIGCHGFFFRHKGIDKLIRAAAALRQEWPRLTLRLVNARFPGEGHDAYILECKRLANTLGMADAIEWYQDFLPMEQIDTLLAGCDVVALPYDESDDSASGAVRVSLSSMVPLVATRVKIFAELGDAAEWSESNDPATLAEALASLLRSPERRRTVQAAMHDWLVEHDWRRVAGTLEGMIHGLVKQRRLDWDVSRG